MAGSVLLVRFGGFRIPGTSQIQDTCCFETLDSNVMTRVTEMKCAFGTNDVDHFCVQVQDYVYAMMDRERRRQKYRGHSPEKAARPTMVRFMMQIAEAEELTRSTLHLAIYLFDRFADAHSIPITQLWLATLCCVIIAGKLEERDSKTPKIKKFKEYLPSAAVYSSALFVELEKFILDYFKWNLLIPNAYTFMEFFALFIVDSHEEPVVSVVEINNNGTFIHPLVIQSDPQFPTRNVNLVRCFAVEVLDALLLDEPNDNYLPSLIAASSIMYARRVHGYPDWSERLQFVTTYQTFQVMQCCQEYVGRVYEKYCNKCTCPHPEPNSNLATGNG